MVRSRIHETCLVAEPIKVKIDGLEIELSLSDAYQLCAGLADAVERVQQAEIKMRGASGDLFNLCVIASTRSGMSIPRSKLGDGEFVFLDGMADSSLKQNISTLTAAVAV